LADERALRPKALLRHAELAHIFHAQAKTFGISGDVSFDFGVAFDRSRTVADGRGSFRDAKSLEVTLSSGGTETLTFDNAIIATGSTVRLLPGVELSDNVVTYETQVLDRDLPESIVIVGAGAIGMEFGYVLKNYGVEVMTAYLNLADQVTALRTALAMLAQPSARRDDPDLGRS
jgi:dihydrolipoamide dehydrogenase